MSWFASVSMVRRMVVCAVLALVAAALPLGQPARAASWPACSGSSVALIGYSDALDKTTFGGTNVGGLSGLVYDAARNVYYSVVDSEGETAARVYTLQIPLSNSGLGTPQISGVTTLKQADGTPFIGHNFDGEGLTLARNGDWLITSEHDQVVRRFTRDGALVSEIKPPQRFKVAPAGEAVLNAGFEGVSLSPSGSSLFIVMEAPLAPDGYTLTGKGRNRILHYVPDGAGFRLDAEYAYLTDSLQAISDVLALSDSSLLVLERSYLPAFGNTIRIYQASVTNATDVSGFPSLATGNIIPASKNLVVDLATCPDGGVPTKEFQTNRLLDNYEDLAWGRTLRGERTVLLLSDDNFNPEQFTRVIALTLPTKAVSGRR